MRSVSRLMYETGNNNYIVVDAILDGQIKLNTKYSCDYQDKVLRINKKELPPALEKRYQARLDSFLTKGKNGSTSFSYMSNKGVSIGDIFKPTSVFRTPFSLDVAMQDNKPEKDMLVNMLVADKLLDTLKDYSVIYAANALYINNTPIPPQQAGKYIRAIRSMDPNAARLTIDHVKY